MEKTSVYLSAEERRRLARLAELTGRSQAEVIRLAIRSFTSPTSDNRDFALTGVSEGVTHRARSIADEDEDQLLAGFGE